MFNWLMTAVGCGICFYLGYSYRKKNENRENKFNLVEKSTGIGGPCKNVQNLSLYFNGDTICSENEMNANLEDATHFYVPVSGNELYINRTIFKDVNLDGSISYDHNGYNTLTKGEMKRAFRHAQKYCATI